jgi:hypothetical protein
MLCSLLKKTDGISSDDFIEDTLSVRIVQINDGSWLIISYEMIAFTFLIRK